MSETVAALVVLRSASGRPLPDDEPITSETLARYAPDPADARYVANELSRLGFRVGPLVGVSMSIDAERTLFEDAFGVRLDHQPDGSWIVRGTPRADPRQLPLGSLPAGVADRISALVLEEPVELHGDQPGDDRPLGP